MKFIAQNIHDIVVTMGSWSLEKTAASFKYLISPIPGKGMNPGRG
jgi:hypothetical protein